MGVVVITGGSRGIGAATAREVAAAGWDVCVGFVADAPAAERIVADCLDFGVRATAVRADILLLLDIRHFEAVYADPALNSRAGQSPPNAMIEINAKLLDSNGRVIATRTFSRSAPASATAVPAVAHAFDDAMTGLTSELVGWTLNSGQQARAALKAAIR